MDSGGCMSFRALSFAQLFVVLFSLVAEFERRIMSMDSEEDSASENQDIPMNLLWGKSQWSQFCGSHNPHRILHLYVQLHRIIRHQIGHEIRSEIDPDLHVLDRRILRVCHDLDWISSRTLETDFFLDT